VIDKTLIVILDNGNVNPILRRWAENKPHSVLASGLCSFSDASSIACRRNEIVERFLAMPENDWLIMVDGDHVPLLETDEILTCTDAVAGCRYPSRVGVESHPDDGEVGMGMVRISRQVLKTIESPWFGMTTNESGSKITQCECSWFCAKARAAGFYPVKVGQIGHLLRVVARLADNSDQVKIQFPSLWQGQNAETMVF